MSDVGYRISRFRFHTVCIGLVTPVTFYHTIGPSVHPNPACTQRGAASEACVRGIPCLDRAMPDYVPADVRSRFFRKLRAQRENQVRPGRREAAPLRTRRRRRRPRASVPGPSRRLR